jgi:parallel beta-helix repeat protein
VSRTLSTWWRRWVHSLTPAGRQRRNASRNPWRRPFLELLEDRCLLSAYVVTSTADDGSAGTLRQAINAVNAGVDNAIVFQIAAAGQQTIMVGSGSGQSLPDITANNVSLNGLNTFNGVTTSVDLNGSDVPYYDGLNVDGNSNTITGLTINNFYQGIMVAGSDCVIGGSAAGAGNRISGNGNDGINLIAPVFGDSVLGNTIGLNAAGTAAQANGLVGVLIDGDGCTIGGTTAGARNIISGNVADGIYVGAAGNVVEGNYVGLNTAGTAAVANGSGSLSDDEYGIGVYSPNNTIGGSVTGAGNVISGNASDGIYLETQPQQVTGVLIQGNSIGTNAAGTSAVANGLYGIQEFSVGSNTIGGLVSAARNVISGNAGGGVVLSSGVNADQILGNYIGLGANGSTALANGGYGVEVYGTNNTLGGTVSAARNVISGNGGGGIFLSGAGNSVLSNYIGLDRSGSKLVANTDVPINVQKNNNTIGGPLSGERNVIDGSLSDGVLIASGVSGTLLQGNYIGTNAAGTAALGNHVGVEIQGSNNTVGGTISGARNLISGNTNDGVLIASGTSGNVLQGNFIGTNASGTSALGNRVGVEIAGSNNTLGGTVSSARNVLSGNLTEGLLIDSTGSGNLVQGNAIGTDIRHSIAVANGSYGVSIASSNNTIGGSVSGAGNYIADNAAGGILVQSGSGNTLRRNLIYANGGSHAGPGIVLNTGTNNNVVAPVLLSASYNSTTQTLTVTGTFNAPTANVPYVLEFFASPAGDDEGEVYLGQKIVTPTKTGTQSFTFTTKTTVPETYPVITSTLTDGSGDTSAFSSGAASR